ncbi:polysaccharide biosynthesis C-terminal domain-containing protein [Aerococcus urinaeequi]|uniref:lipopolysaccharide biosynthesis protein n=1 Tax=Aerococcus urinaeequi TaxID=51665 RepID=UPI003D6B2C35
MDSVKKLKMNTAASFIQRFVIILYGLILPRLIISYYGAEVHGLTTSINQFLSIITFLDLGIGPVIQSYLYRPLANNDTTQVSLILSSAKSYFRKLSYILVGYIILLMIVYPLIIDQPSSSISIAFLIFAMSINQFAQYYFGIINELLLNADQKSYIQYGSEIIVVILNLLASIFLITQGVSIQILKLSTSLIYLIRPIYLNYYVNKNYNIDIDIEVTEDPIPQRWNGIAQHVSWFIQSSTDIVILTLFSTLNQVSIYSVYNMIVQAVRTVITSLTNELTPFFGNLLAKSELIQLKNYFTKVEWIVHTGVIYLFGMTAVLINPFVKLYTIGIEDVNYYAPLFSFILVLAHTIYSFRAPYQLLIFAAGHYKQTQVSSIIEALINVSVSALLVNQLGLVGIAIGTFCALAYRTIYLVFYLSKNIINRPIKMFVKQVIVDLITFGTMITIGIIVFQFIEIDTILSWVITAVIFGIVFAIITFGYNFLFYQDNLLDFLKRFQRKSK